MACEWWEIDESLPEEEDERRRALALAAETAKIEERQHAWYELGLWNATIYNNRVLAGYRWGSETEMEKELWPANLRTENLVESIGQAMLSKASSSPLKPALVPHGNSFKTARSVRKADKFLFGAWRQANAEDACIRMFDDAYTNGLGCVQVVFDNKKLHVEAIFPDNIVIDNRECANRATPRTYRIRKMVQRCAVEGLYGIQLEEQKEAYNAKRAQGKDWVPIIEVFRKPDRDGRGGRHMVVCCGCIIKDENWKHDWVPFIFFHWVDRKSGFFGKGGVEQVIPYQVMQNELNDDIQEAQRLACRFKVLAHVNSNLNLDQWTNKNGAIAFYSGVEPKPWESRTNLGELYNERERNKAAAYSAMAMSEQYANADLPSQVRLDSSAAVREQQNMEDSRHLRLWTNFQGARLEVARTILNVLSVSKGATAYTTSTGHRASARQIPYDAIKELTTEMYTWTLEPVPITMMSPASRRETLRDNSSRGQSEKGADDSKRMVSNADIEMIEDLELADRDDIERHLELLENDEYEAPTEFTALSMGLMLVKANMKRLLQFDDVTPSTPMIQSHIRWMVSAGSLIANALKMQEAQQAQQAQMTPFAPTQGMSGTSAAQAPGKGGFPSQ